MDWIAPLEKEVAHDTLEIAFGEFENPSSADPNRQIPAVKKPPWNFLAALLLFCLLVVAAAPILPEDGGAAWPRMRKGFWRSCAKPSPPPSPTRQLFAYALVLVCEARQHPDRLDRLFALAEQMQDRDPHKPRLWQFLVGDARQKSHGLQCG